MLFETIVAVLMSGLVTHVGSEQTGGPDVKRRAVLVADRHHNHKARLLIEGRFTADGKDVDLELSDSDELTLSGIDGGGATVSEDFCLACGPGYICDFCQKDPTPKLFRQFIPNLTEPLTQSRLHNDIKEGKRHDNVAAYFNYPKGILFIAFYHRAEAKFVRDNDVVRRQCVPRVTAYLGRSAGRIALRFKDKPDKDIWLAEFAVVHLLNEPNASADDDKSAAAHFSNYTGLLRRRYRVTPHGTPSKITRGVECVKEPTLPKEATTAQLPTLFLQRYFRERVLADQPQNASHAAAYPWNLRVSEHPACTNTDWP